MFGLRLAPIRRLTLRTASGTTRLATSPLLAMAVAIAACWFLGWGLPVV